MMVLLVFAATGPITSFWLFLFSVSELNDYHLFIIKVLMYAFLSHYPWFWIAVLGFLRRPLAIVAALLTALSIAFLNDRLAVFLALFIYDITLLVLEFTWFIKLFGPMVWLIRWAGFVVLFLCLCPKKIKNK